ncbi:RsmB/NOP family class I SAM-dependent RNA methyltransferase [Clostridium sp. D33t1_170424_F3]|uniref:RsmB/NOP family class I SAM-dependent RNA methyltransferase n=1 Tax=Clostridium sp. D33t1_170424_F3 TaxID=2787099 RepID=UPI002570DB96|nr:RsmB/NOP family class I SAM-dependent RNA methyltransferase [Clostridium sp. D33t1_170424_F3]
MEDFALTALPQAFLSRMESFLGKEYALFLACYGKSHLRGVRLNPLKCDEATLLRSLPFAVLPTPFSRLSYYAPEGVDKLGVLPMHHAGAFYSQEPSAASAVTVLDPLPGERVLDLCAAPGGKSTQIAALLMGKGLLWSNEIIKSRANVLLSNIERMGVRNVAVSSCRPDVLCERLAGFFDKVLVDAPCSGEGMFRRDTRAVEEWSPEHVASCAARQLAILNSASQALKEGGILVYSTCTFSQEENEDVVTAFLQQNRDFELLDCGASFGRPGTLPQTRRIFPMDGGEGHFVARLRRLSANDCAPPGYLYQKESKDALECSKWIFKKPPEGIVQQINANLLLMPEGLPCTEGLNVLRAGVLLGEKKQRVEPAHAAFMAAKPAELVSVLSFPHDSKEAAAFLHGEELEAPESCKGYTGVAIDGVLTGFGKCSNGRLKNRYPKGLRNH